MGGEKRVSEVERKKERGEREMREGDGEDGSKKRERMTVGRGKGGEREEE